jgi:hypothetical protein
LNQAKLVLSQTGSTGGTRLSALRDQSVEVYRAVCGEVFAFRQVAEPDCPVGGTSLSYCAICRKRSIKRQKAFSIASPTDEKIEHGGYNFFFHHLYWDVAKDR